MSGIASTLLVLGTIIHKRFGVPIPCFNYSSFKIKMNSNELKTIKNTSLILIDEESMINKGKLDLLDRFLRELTELDQKMRWKWILLVYDSRHNSTVVPGGSSGDIMYASEINNEILHTTFTPNEVM